MRHDSFAGTAQTAPAEYDVKAAFVYNFAKFVDWPAAVPSSNGKIRLCILGTAPDRAAFSALEGRQVRGMVMRVVAVERPEDVTGCSILFVSADQGNGLPELVRVLADRPILTIGDTEGYARRGVMINMFLEKKRVRFEINEEKARSAGLRISAKLLKLASRVYGPAGLEEE